MPRHPSHQTTMFETRTVAILDDTERSADEVRGNAGSGPAIVEQCSFVAEESGDLRRGISTKRRNTCSGVGNVACIELGDGGPKLRVD